MSDEKEFYLPCKNCGAVHVVRKKAGPPQFEVVLKKAEKPEVAPDVKEKPGEIAPGSGDPKPDVKSKQDDWGEFCEWLDS